MLNWLLNHHCSNLEQVLLMIASTLLALACADFIIRMKSSYKQYTGKN